MKKVFSLLAVLALVCMASSVWAQNFATKAAVASFESAGEVSFSATLYKFTGQASQYTNPTSAESTGITWDISTIPLNSSTRHWQAANVYCLIKSTITTASGRVVIYQDNANNDDDYKDTTATPQPGLVKKNSGGGSNLDFQYMSVKLSSATSNCVTSQPNFDRANASWQDPYGSRGFKDLSVITTSPSQADLEYITIAKSTGIWDGASFFNPGDNVLFFGAEFKNILGGDSYGTQTIKFATQVE